jgi:hypothetical protein
MAQPACPRGCFHTLYTFFMSDIDELIHRWFGGDEAAAETIYSK